MSNKGQKDHPQSPPPETNRTKRKPQRNDGGETARGDTEEAPPIDISTGVSQASFEEARGGGALSPTDPPAPEKRREPATVPPEDLGRWHLEQATRETEASGVIKSTPTEEEQGSLFDEEPDRDTTGA